MYIDAAMRIKFYFPNFFCKILYIFCIKIHINKTFPSPNGI